MGRLTLHPDDVVVFRGRDGHLRTGVLRLIPYGRRLWAGIRCDDGKVHVVPRANVVSVNP